MALNTQSGVFGHFLRMDLFTFHESDLYFSRNGSTQSRYNAQWEAAAHMNKLHHKLLQEMQGNESSLDDMCHLGNDWELGLEHFARGTSRMWSCGPWISLRDEQGLQQHTRWGINSSDFCVWHRILVMRNTNNHGIEGNSIRMDRIVIVNRLLLEDGHDCPLCTNFGSHSGEFSILRVNNLRNQWVRIRLTL